MEDDFDLEAMLDAPLSRKNTVEKSPSPPLEKRKKSKKKHRSREREEYPKEYPKGYSKEYPREYPSKYYERRGGPHHRGREYRDRRAPEYYTGGDRRGRSRSPPPERWRHGGGYRGSRDYPPPPRKFGRGPRERSRSPEKRVPEKRPEKTPRSPSPAKKDAKKPPPPPAADLFPEERDMRTVFCMQLSQRVKPRDLEEFFAPVGKVTDVRLIMDNKTRRSKGIAYVEFQDTFSVSLAMGYTGKRLLGVPIIVQLTQAEKNRAASALVARGNGGPMRLYIGSLHFNVTEEMLRGIFEPFGKIDKIELLKDGETGRSKGYGFITFHDGESAKKALEQLNGFSLAGRPMKVGPVNDRAQDSLQPAQLDSEELDRAGIDLGATGRLQLMAKLAEGTGMELPQAALNALQLSAATPLPPAPNPAVSVATQCFVLSNMFDPDKESSSGVEWWSEIRRDVLEECRSHGGALHVYVDRASPEGNVYVKCPNLTVAAASVAALHGRYFAGRVIVAAYVPVLNYHMLFPDSASATAVL